MSERVLCACIVGLVDKYTLKSQKQVKQTQQVFIKFVLSG